MSNPPNSLNEVLKRLTSFSQQINEALTLIQKPPKLPILPDFVFPQPILSAFAKMQEARETASVLREAGWLPHRTMPFHLITETSEASDISAAIHDHYIREWPTASKTIVAQCSEYSVDEEAKSTFIEAIAAHQSGYFRCVCRVLFPEIERVIMQDLKDFKTVKNSLPDRLLEIVNEMPAFASYELGFHSLDFYSCLKEHSYSKAIAADEIKKLSQDGVPNRHAAIHGKVIYKTMQNSLNTIFLCDAVFSFLTAIKRTTSASEASAGNQT